MERGGSTIFMVLCAVFALWSVETLGGGGGCGGVLIIPCFFIFSIFASLVLLVRRLDFRYHTHTILFRTSWCACLPETNHNQSLTFYISGLERCLVGACDVISGAVGSALHHVGAGTVGCGVYVVGRCSPLFSFWLLFFLMLSMSSCCGSSSYLGM